MTAVIGIAISILALAVSVVTAWMTLFHRGRIAMTQPTTIYFGPDGSRYGLEPRHQKVFFRTLLYSTAKRGHVVENMFIRLQRGETRQNFNVWVYGDDDLRRGSGLFVPDGGVATNHHFLPPPDFDSFKFVAGHYVLEVFATIVGAAQAKLLFVVRLDVSTEIATALGQSNSGVYFDWEPDAGHYQGNVKPPPPKPESSALLSQTLEG
jgi:hypothetical protein